MAAKLGIMQGRLSKPLNGKIQSFPTNTWKKEFYVAKEIGFELIEWVLDEDLKYNPIMNKNSFKIIKQIKEETQIEVNSICCDFFKHFSFNSSNVSDPYCDCSLSPNRLRFGPLIIIILLVIQHFYTMKKIKIKVNGKFKTVLNNSKLSDLLKNLNIPLKKVAIELNQEIIDKKRTSNIKLKKNDKIEIVHFIGGG